MRSLFEESIHKFELVTLADHFTALNQPGQHYASSGEALEYIASLYLSPIPVALN